MPGEQVDVRDYYWCLEQINDLLCLTGRKKYEKIMEENWKTVR